MPFVIIYSAAFLNKEKWGKIENSKKTEWINQKLEIAVFIDLSALVEMT